MNLNVTGHHVDLTDPLRDYVNSKFEKVERHFDNLVDGHVILKVENDRQKAEATVNAPGKTIFADAEDNDMYAAIDAMTDKIDRQVRRYKQKLKDHHRGEVDKSAGMAPPLENV